MTVFPTVEDIRRLHEHIIASSGGSAGILNVGGLKSAVDLPQTTFGGEEMYPTLESKAAAIGYALVRNHVFVDGNKRIGHAAAEFLLRLNGLRLSAGVDEQERIILGVAASEVT